MGNYSEHSHTHQHLSKSQWQSIKLIGTNQRQNINRQVAIEQNLCTTGYQVKRKHSLKSLGGKSNSGSKQKKFLSLSKTASSETSILKDSKLRKGINITATDQHSTRNSVDKFIKVQHKQINQNSENSIKKIPIRPRDLPKYSSHNKINTPISLSNIPVQTSITQTRQVEPPISYQQQPNITIKYVVAQATKTEDSLLASAVTPFVDKLNQCGNTSNRQYNPMGDNRGKKLKKVGMSRSFAHQKGLQSVQNYEELDSKEKTISTYQIHGQYVKENQFYSNRYIKQTEQKENQHIFTDPKLMSYIQSNQQIRTIKETESIYALAYYHHGTLIEKPITLPTYYSSTSIFHDKYSLPLCFQHETLENKVQREVQSNQLIDYKQTQSEVLIEQPFRFQTATDISYEQRSDNTSFIPLPPNYNSRIDDNSYFSDELLNYCKPKINEKVLADLLKLPLKV